MSKSPLASSKSALVFAAMIIVSTLMIVGPGEGGGLVDRTVGRLAQQRETIAEEARTVSEERTEVIEPLDPAAGWGGTGDPVFGEFTGEAAPVAEAESASTAPSSPAAPAAPAVRRASGASARIAGPVKADSLGVLVSRDGSEGTTEVQVGVPVVTSRTLKIEPQ